MHPEGYVNRFVGNRIVWASPRHEAIGAIAKLGGGAVNPDWGIDLHCAPESLSTLEHPANDHRIRVLLTVGKHRSPVLFLNQMHRPHPLQRLVHQVRFLDELFGPRILLSRL